MRSLLGAGLRPGDGAPADVPVGTCTRTSPLEILHPDGPPGRVRLLGGGCPPCLRPGPGAGETGAADLVLLAPTPAECRRSGWIESAAGSAAEALSPDGVVYVLAPPRWRWRVLRALRVRGLVLAPPMLHLPDAASSRHLVPLSPAALRYTLSRLVQLRPWKVRLAATLLSPPGVGRVLGLLLPSVGWAARPRSARPLFDWARSLCPGDEPREFVTDTRRSGEGGGAVVHGTSADGGRAALVAKLSLDGSAAPLAVEEERTNRVGATARAAGVSTPAASMAYLGNGLPVLVQTGLRGRPAASLLRGHPERAPGVLEEVAAWLERWARSTGRVRTVGPDRWSAELLAPAARLAPLLDGGAEYLDWLAGRLAPLSHAPIPLVAAHRDLTTWNVLVDDRGRLGVFDWETASPDALPLTDFYYAAVDVFAVVHRPIDRPSAFLACFGPDGRFGERVARLEERLRRASGVPAEVAEVCFHACWLHHALNEHEAREGAGSPPFLQILRWIALHPSRPKAGEGPLPDAS